MISMKGGHIQPVGGSGDGIANNRYGECLLAAHQPSILEARLGVEIQ